MTWVPSAVPIAASWVFWACVMAGIGTPAVLLLSRRRLVWGDVGIRVALWFGLSLIATLVIGLQLLLPMGGTSGLALLLALTVAGCLGLILAARRLRWRAVVRPWLRWSGLLLLLLAGLLALTAFWSAGQPTNYDTGLYHLGSIAYAREFPLVPGLANLHDRFGFNSSAWPLVALLDVGPLPVDGFRVLNGLLMTMVLADLSLRLLFRRRRPTAGTFVLAIGAVFSFSAVAQYPGRLVASPAQDTAALLLITVATAYLVDSVTSHRSVRLNASTALLAAVVAATVRPLGWVFAGGVSLVLVVVLVRRTSITGAARTLLPAGVLSAVILLLMLLRDAVLSGWLLFPLSLFPIDAAWRTADPKSAARDITGWARTPFQDVDVTLADNSWISGWLTRLPTDWSIPALALLLVALIGLAASGRGRVVIRRRWRWIALCLLPIAVTLAAWFVNAPDPRFAWAVILGLGSVPLGIVLAELGEWRRFALVSSIVLVVLFALAVGRGTLGDIAWTAEPPPVPAVAVDQLVDGTPIVSPTGGLDQCWEVWPLCAPAYADRAVELRGLSIEDGFQPAW